MCKIFSLKSQIVLNKKGVCGSTHFSHSVAQAISPKIMVALHKNDLRMQFGKETYSSYYTAAFFPVSPCMCSHLSATSQTTSGWMRLSGSQN